MNGWRDEYTQFEWVQMGLLLVGMPVAAVVGALLGMVGRWKQGRVLTAALVGMGGAAFVSIALFLLFLAIPLLAGDGRRLTLLDLFDSTFSQWLAAKAIIATGAISLLAAIGLRLRKRDEKSGAAALSMRQLMLLQLFSFIALGCWTGMRFIALESVSGYERAHRKWSKHDWTVTGNGQGEPSKLHRVIGMKKVYDDENVRLQAASQEPWLEELELEDILEAERLDLGPLRGANRLKLMSLSFAPNRNRLKNLPLPLATTLLTNGNITQSTVDQLSAINSLQSLRIQGGDFSADLTPLSKLTKLTALSLSESSIDPKSFNAFSKSSKLPLLSMVDVLIVGPETLQFPADLIQLSYYSPTREGFSSEKLGDLKQLRHLSLHLPFITEQDLKAISSLPRLEFLDLSGVEDPKHLELLASNHELVQLTFRGKIKLRQHHDYRQLLMLLAEQPKLSRIRCRSQFIYDDDAPYIVQPTSITDPTQWLREFESRKQEIKLVSREKMAILQSQIDDHRNAHGLGKLSIDFDEYQPRGISEGMDPLKLLKRIRDAGIAE